LRVVAIVGSKKSGKTTVVERMLGRLRGDGLRVGTLKMIHHEGFTIHADGRDTARHWKAGAEFSIALAPGETAMVRRTRGTHETLDDLDGLVPEGTDALLCEGLMVGGDDVRTVVCSREADQARAFLAELSPGSHAVAVSGLVAASVDEVEGLPALDVTDDGQLEELIQRVLD
jgi:molybdopterin-guanine dinucleotide biosynthesis protein MobB